MNIRLLLAAALCWPLHAMSMGFPSFTTEIPGVQLWWLEASQEGLPQEYFEDDKNEFVRYCDGTRSIYVSSVESPIPCKSVGGDTYSIHLKATDRHLSGLVVVSKRPLPSRAKLLPITAEETERLRKAEEAPKATYVSEAKRSFMEMFRDATAVDYAKFLREIKATPDYRKYGGARFKLSSPHGFIYISALVLFPGGIGWEIKNVVFREIDGKLHEIGAFSGCIEGFRDLNADGTPEVLTKFCENTEGSEYTFWSLVPRVRPVVTRRQS